MIYRYTYIHLCACVSVFLCGVRVRLNVCMCVELYIYIYIEREIEDVFVFMSSPYPMGRLMDKCRQVAPLLRHLDQAPNIGQQELALSAHTLSTQR